MTCCHIARLVQGSGDAAFAIDRLGLISAWNNAAKELFGFSSTVVVGRPGHKILHGVGKGESTCLEDCAIQQALEMTGNALEMNRPVANFDLQVQTTTGTQWCNFSVLIVTEPVLPLRHAVFILHPREIRKRLELLIRDFLISQTEMTPDAAVQLLSSGRAPVRDAKLTARETEILRMLADASSTKVIAGRLHISVATVNNHITHILAKLDAHTRLEAVRRSERAGLI